jgi:hypothetical protein
MKKNPILIIVSVILLTASLYGWWSKNQASEKPAFVGEKSSYESSDIEKSPAFLSKEALPDGAMKYFTSSHLPFRPNMYVLKNGQIILQRSITALSYPIKMSDYIKSYGEPQVVKELNNFYDPAAKLYVYPEEKLAFIANPESQEVLEQHIFTISVEEYLKKYSEEK